MKKIFLLFSFAVMSYFVNGECFPNGLSIHSQNDIDEFLVEYPNCTEIGGTLQIYGGNDLSGFKNIKKLNDLKMFGGEFEDLIGFEKIKDVNWIEISNLSKLTSLNGLNPIRVINGIVINNNGALSSIEMDSLVTVGIIQFENNKALKIIQGLNNVENIFAFSVLKNPSLEFNSPLKN